MASKSGFSIADLQQGAKRLHHNDNPALEKRSDDVKSSAGDVEALTKLGNGIISTQIKFTDFYITYL